MGEAEPTAGCEACAKASEKWLKGDYPDASFSVAAMLDANQRAHHAEIAALRERSEKAEALYAKANRAYGLAEMGRIHTEEERRRFLDERNALRDEADELRVALSGLLHATDYVGLKTRDRERKEDLLHWRAEAERALKEVEP